MHTVSLPIPSARPRRLWFPAPKHTDEGSESPLWEDLRAADAARRLLH